MKDLELGDKKDFELGDMKGLELEDMKDIELAENLKTLMSVTGRSELDCRNCLQHAEMLDLNVDHLKQVQDNYRQ